jgi:hypothetical protein
MPNPTRTQNPLPKTFVQIVENLDEEQLHAAYNLLGERLNLLHRAKSLYAMRNFHIMDRVSFTNNGQYYEGNVTRLNQKTITVTLDNGQRWGVTPVSLTKIETLNPLQDILTEDQWKKMRKNK